LQAVAPVFARDARGVDFAAADLESLAVEQEVIGANSEGVAGGGSFDGYRGCEKAGDEECSM